MPDFDERNRQQAEAAAPTPDVAPRVVSTPTRSGHERSRLAVGSADDPAEADADRLAERALSSIRLSAGGSRVARRSARFAPDGGVVDDGTQREIEVASGGGSVMPGGLRRSMEDAFEADFSAVRLHVDHRSDVLNDRLGSRAFALGPEVFVRRSEYRPDSASGQRLLAHELAHTLQDGGRDSGRVRRRISDGSTSGPAPSGISTAAPTRRTRVRRDGGSDGESAVGPHPVVRARHASRPGRRGTVIRRMPLAVRTEQGGTEERESEQLTHPVSVEVQSRLGRPFTVGPGDFQLVAGRPALKNTVPGLEDASPPERLITGVFESPKAYKSASASGPISGLMAIGAGIHKTKPRAAASTEGLADELFADLPDTVPDIEEAGSLARGTATAYKALGEASGDLISARSHKNQLRALLGVSKLKNSGDAASKLAAYMLYEQQASEVKIQTDNARLGVMSAKADLGDHRAGSEGFAAAKDRLDRAEAKYEQWREKLDAEWARRRLIGEGFLKIPTVRQDVIEAQARVKALERILSAEAAKELRVVEALRKDVARERREAEAAFAAQELALAKAIYADEDAAMFHKELGAPHRPAELDDEHDAYQLAGFDAAHARSRHEELERARTTITSAKPGAARMRSVVAHLSSQEAHATRLMKLVSYLAGGETGSMSLTLKVSLNLGMTTADKSFAAGLELAVSVTGNLSVSDDRKFRAALSIGLSSGANAKIPGDMLKLTASSGLTGVTTRVFADDQAWASWLAFRIAKIQKVLTPGQGPGDPSFADQVTPEDMSWLADTFGEEGAAEAQRILAYNRSDISQNTVTSVASLASKLEAGGTAFAVIGSGGAVSEKAMRFTRDGRTTVGFQGERELNAKIGAINIAHKWTSIIGHPIPDNDGDYYTLTITTPVSGGASLAQPEGVGQSSEVLPSLASALDKLRFPESDDEVNAAGSFVADQIKGEFFKFPALKVLGENVSSASIGASRMVGRETNFIKSDGRWAKQYQRVIGGWTASAGIALPTGAPGLDVGIDLQGSASRSLDEELGTDTLTYVQTVYNGLIVRDRRDVALAKLDDLAQGQWRKWAGRHRAEILRIARQVGRDGTIARAEIAGNSDGGSRRFVSYCSAKSFQRTKEVDDGGWELLLSKLEAVFEANTKAAKAEVDWSAAPKQSAISVTAEPGFISTTVKVADDGGVTVGQHPVCDATARVRVWIAGVGQARMLRQFTDEGFGLHMTVDIGAKKFTFDAGNNVGAENFVRAVTNVYRRPSDLPQALRRLAGLTGAALRARDYTDDILNEMRVAFVGKVMQARTRFVMPAPPDR